MKIIRQGNFKPKPWGRTVVTIGNFDGVHLGHQEILTKLLSLANGRTPVAITFDPHPARVIRPDIASQLIECLDERIDRLAEFGIEHLWIVPFDKEFARISAQDFVRDYLQEMLGAEGLVIGSDGGFGRDRLGDRTLFSEASSNHPFFVETVPAVEVEGQRVSSTRIKKELERGDVALVTRMLGRKFAISGEVIHGFKKGRTLGFPTANLQMSATAIPGSGIYACLAGLKDGRSLPAAVSIGNRPTFKTDVLSIEAHILDFDEDIYGQKLSLDFIERQRGQVRFETVAALVDQMKKDVLVTRKILDRV